MSAERRRIFVGDVPRVVPRHQRRVDLAGPLIRAGGSRAIFELNRDLRKLSLLNDELKPVAAIDLSRHLPDQLTPQAQAYRLLHIPSDMSVIVLGLDHIVCIDADGTKKWQFNHPAWPSFVGGAALTVDELVGVVVPMETAANNYRQVAQAQLVLLNPTTGSERHRLPLEGDLDHPEGFHAIGRANQAGGAIDAGYGQDGSEIWRVASTNGQIDVTRLDRVDRVLADVSPSGDELLTTPHLTDHLGIYRWNDLEEIATLARADVFELETDVDDLTADRFDFYAWYLDPDRILALTRQGRLVVIDRGTMSVLHQLVVEGFDIIGYDERGKRVDDPARALDFEGEISDVTVLDESRIVVQSRSDRGEICEL